MTLIILKYSVQNSLARDVTRSTTNTTSAVNSLNWLPIQQRINFKLATLVPHSLHNAGPQYLSSLLHPYTQSRQLRSASLNLLSQPCINICSCLLWFSTCWPFSLEIHPRHLRSIDSYTVFKSNLKTYLFTRCFLHLKTILCYVTCFKRFS